MYFYDVKAVDPVGFGYDWYTKPFWATVSGGRKKAVEVRQAVTDLDHGGYMDVYSVKLEDGSFRSLTTTDGTWREEKGHAF